MSWLAVVAAWFAVGLVSGWALRKPWPRATGWYSLLAVGEILVWATTRSPTRWLCFAIGTGCALTAWWAWRDKSVVETAE